MSKEIVLGVVRHVLNGAGVYLVAKGITEQGVVNEGIGGLMTLFSVAWSVWDKKLRA